MSVALWWIRRDLRLTDSPALHAARAHGAVVPVFVWDPAFRVRAWYRESHARRAFLAGGLAALAADLERRGSRLVVADGDPREVLRKLLTETGADAIYALADATAGARERDAALARELPLRLLPGICVHAPGTVLTAQGTPYTVFTPFHRAWRAQPFPNAQDCHPAPDEIPAPPRWPASRPLDAADAPTRFAPGEAEAQRRLDRFVAWSIADYAARRDVLAAAATSTLSPYLRFGMLSPRIAAMRAAEATLHGGGHGAETWLKELVWREFYLHVLYHFPHVTRTAFNARLRHVAWRDAPADLAAWQQGMTGYPIVDACMRQLLAEGWMHNRGRMIVASFLAKDLLVDWRHGERWFMQHLVDGDPAANNGGWQWAAGVGTDAAPYFRIFNPVLQGEKFDPGGEFVRRYVPDLANVPARYVHRPWEMPPLELSLCGVVLGETYPHRIVDRAIVKARTLAAYQAAQARDPAG
ncbi:MAG: deoxyribodipyrimidine photo-lyase [Gammaproteobacteria bacterium]